MNDYTLRYKGPKFQDIDISPVKYCDDYFQAELDLESDLFFELRKNNGIKPFRINESSNDELTQIKDFFGRNKDTFFFLFNNDEIIGSVLYINNYIKALSINRKYQRMGYGTMLAKFVINRILSSDHSEVVLNVMNANIPALKLYKNIGFEIVKCPE